MALAQKWLLGLIGLGAGLLVFSNPDAVYKVSKGFEQLTAGSVVAVATGKQPPA
jgi:hypothetical protein